MPRALVLLASPFPAMRAGLRALLEQAAGDAVEVVGEAESVEACLDLAVRTQPQVVIFDLALDADEEAASLWRLSAELPAVPVLALSDSHSDLRVLAALQAGARGCLPKTADGAELAQALQRVAAGQTLLHPSSTATLIEQLRGETRREALTPRETQVLQGVAVGLTNKAIALRLGISDHTVKFHLGSAMSKLGAASRAEAVAIALRRGMISI